MRLDIIYDKTPMIPVTNEVLCNLSCDTDKESKQWNQNIKFLCYIVPKP